MKNPINLEQYAIKRIEDLEAQVKALSDDVDAWKTLYNRDSQLLGLVCEALREIGTHEFSSIYQCNVIRFDNISESYDHKTYEVLSQVFAPAHKAALASEEAEEDGKTAS